LKRTHALTLFLCAAAGVLFVSCGIPEKDVLAITRVTVIDMTGTAPLADQTVVLKKDRIAEVGPARSAHIPRGAKIVDGSGRFLIPGLADMHVHLTAMGEPDGSRKVMIPLLLANGITQVRDMGGFLESLNPLRQEIVDGKRLGPRIVYAGPYLDGAPPSFQPSLVVTNHAQADEDVHQLVERGVDFIKVQSVLSRDAYFAVADVSRRENISFVGHVPDHVTAAEAADAGQRSIEHLTNVLRGCSRDEGKLMREQFAAPKGQQTPAQSQARGARWLRELLDNYSPTAAAALITKFREKGVWQTPTLVLLRNDAFTTPENKAAAEARHDYIPDGTMENWRKSRAEQMKYVSPQDFEVRAQLLRTSMDVVALMQKAGVKILAGTDSPAPYVFPGSGLHEELALLVRAGLTPMEALQAATCNPAEFLGTSKDSGTVAAGKYADLLLLDDNPLEDIRNTQKIRAVFVRGRMLDSAALDNLLDSVRTDVASHRHFELLR
jgi:imidazolonepropionase-like amidohydrolase